MTGSAHGALAVRFCLHINLLPVVLCLCSPALAPSCSFSRAEAVSQSSSAALPAMRLQTGPMILGPGSGEGASVQLLRLAHTHVGTEWAQSIGPPCAALAGTYQCSRHLSPWTGQPTHWPARFLILFSSTFHPDFQASKAGGWVGRWHSVGWGPSEPTSPGRACTHFGTLWRKPDGSLPGPHEGDQCAGPLSVRARRSVRPLWSGPSCRVGFTEVQEV